LVTSIGITNDANSWVTNANHSTYTDTGLIPGQTYYYVVTATNLAGESGYSSEVAVTFQLAPQNVVATGGTNQVSLTWNSLGGATNYVVKRATLSGGPYTIAGSNTVANFTDTGLAGGTRYYYIVQANLISGTPSGNSSEATAITAPNTPANLVADAF